MVRMTTSPSRCSAPIIAAGSTTFLGAVQAPSKNTSRASRVPGARTVFEAHIDGDSLTKVASIAVHRARVSSIATERRRSELRAPLPSRL